MKTLIFDGTPESAQAIWSQLPDVAKNRWPGFMEKRPFYITSLKSGPFVGVPTDIGVENARAGARIHIEDVRVWMDYGLNSAESEAKQ